jgi:hypothetical protein
MIEKQRSARSYIDFIVGTRVYRLINLFVILAVLLLGAAPPAQALLERVGPVSTAPSIGGYPLWYQDSTGLALEFCNPSAAELTDMWCLLGVAEVPNPPEVFPDNFFDEHFWYSVGAVFPAGTILWEAAVEAAFAADVAPGGQIVFTRIRVRFDADLAGTYIVTHPYGEDVIEHPGNDRIFVTDDVGIACPTGQFHCAMEGRVGPFLLASNSPGGPELAAVTGPVPGKLYIADPTREGPVTGSPTGNNFVRIVGPPGSNIGGSGLDVIQTQNFTLMGRVFQGTIGSQVTVDRASYAQPVATSPTQKKVDVFATAFPARAARLPGQPEPAAVAPVLQFYGAACDVNLAGDLIPPPAGTPTTQMSSPGAQSPPQPAPASIYWGQSQPAEIPAGVCVEHTNAVGGPALISARVTDEVTITEALYDPADDGTLSVRAVSSDQLLQPPPQLLASGLGTIDPATGQFTLTPLAAPPARVRVLSELGGTNEFNVSTGVGTGSTGATPVAVNDSATVSEDCSVTPATSCATPLVITPWVNDTVNGQLITAANNPVITVVQAPTKGTAVPAAGGTVSYTPSPNANGPDAFTYRVTVNNVASNIASVQVSITPVNDAPTAVNDTAVAVLNVAAQINVLGNDTDPDGQADLAAAVIVTGSANLGLAAGAVFLGPVTVTPAETGPQTFTYQARDAAGTLSPNAATVTVNVGGAETVTIQQAEFRTTARRWRVSGTINPTNTGSVNITYANGPNTGFSIGTAPIVGGTWALDVSGVTGLRDPRTGQATQIRVTGPSGGTATANITLRR